MLIISRHPCQQNEMYPTNLGHTPAPMGVSTWYTVWVVPDGHTYWLILMCVDITADTMDANFHVVRYCTPTSGVKVFYMLGPPYNRYTSRGPMRDQSPAAHHTSYNNTLDDSAHHM